MLFHRALFLKQLHEKIKLSNYIYCLLQGYYIGYYYFKATKILFLLMVAYQS